MRKSKYISSNDTWLTCIDGECLKTFQITRHWKYGGDPIHARRIRHQSNMSPADGLRQILGSASSCGRGISLAATHGHGKAPNYTAKANMSPTARIESRTISNMQSASVGNRHGLTKTALSWKECGPSSLRITMT